MKLRSVVRWVASTVGGTVLSPFLQAPATKLAETLHFDTALSDRWGPLVQWFSDLTGDPWYIALAGLAVGFALGMWVDTWLRDRERGNATESPAAASKAQPPPEKAAYLSDVVIVDGIGSTFPEFRARFARNGQGGTFYIEHSFHAGGYGMGWTTPRKIAVFRKSRFTSGEMVSFPLVSPGMTDDGTTWFFGPSFAADGEPATDRLNAGTHYQGRVTFLSNEDTEEHCYFIASTTDAPGMPIVTGEHMFSHMQEWEGEKARNGDVDGLFK